METRSRRECIAGWTWTAFYDEKRHWSSFWNVLYFVYVFSFFLYSVFCVVCVFVSFNDGKGNISCFVLVYIFVSLFCIL